MAAANTAELKKLDKDTLVEAVRRLGNRARKYKEDIKERAEQAMEFALAGGTAFGVGYYMGMVERDNPGDPDALKLFGVDTDLLIGVALAGVGLTGLGGKRMSGAARAAGIGALSLWAGNYGRQMALTAEQ